MPISPGAPARPGGALLTRFVVQEHRARSRHFDFRLEKDGVLKSWAVPRTPPLAAGEKRLAIQVEDHSLDYGDFAGEIPAGQSGAGSVRLWDRGSGEVREWTDDRIVFVLHGARLRGCFGLIRLRSLGPRRWLFLSMRRGTSRAPLLPRGKPTRDSQPRRNQP
jgi:bifunctional non-homologous end joining protein LigD